VFDQQVSTRTGAASNTTSGVCGGLSHPQRPPPKLRDSPPMFLDELAACGMLLLAREPEVSKFQV